MNQPSTAASRANGESTAHDLFALSDEQILDIDPEPQDVQVSADARSSADHGTRDSNHVTSTAEAPDASSNTNAPAAPFSTAEDVRALAELYPGGVAQAKSAAERARALEDFDSAYFGAPGNSPEQISAARAQLAQRMLREDPAAFREMVFAGLRALESAGQPSVPAVFRQRGLDTNGVQAPPTSLGVTGETSSDGSISPMPQNTPPTTEGVNNSQHLATYRAFETAANADLEKSVGGAIERALQHALPNFGRGDDAGSAGGRLNASPGTGAASLQARLSGAIRQDVELALQGDRQLGEQVAQILAARRFDDATRAQVVRLINDRALQLVPGAAKRALNDWTQATLSAHRARGRHVDASASRREVPAAASSARDAHSPASPIGNRATPNATQAAQRHSSKGRVDYSRLSDDQILDL